MDLYDLAVDALSDVMVERDYYRACAADMQGQLDHERAKTAALRRVAALARRRLVR